MGKPPAECDGCCRRPQIVGLELSLYVWLCVEFWGRYEFSRNTRFLTQSERTEYCFVIRPRRLSEVNRGS